MLTSTEGEKTAETPEATEATDSSKEKPSKSDKDKTAPTKAGVLKQNAKTNGTAVKKPVNVKSTGQKNLKTGPKKAKIAKMDEETEDGTEAQKSGGKMLGQRTAKPGKEEGRKFEKKQGKKVKIHMKGKNRMAKNKLKKMRHKWQNKK